MAALSLVAALAAIVHVAAPFAGARDLARDALVRLAAAFPPAAPPGAPDALIVAIDAQSLRELADWPWPRNRWAALVRKLDAAGAAAIVFDVDFSTARDARDDAEFGAAIAASHHVVLGAFYEEQSIPAVGTLEMSSLPIDVLGRDATLACAISPLDGDGAVRRAQTATDLAQQSLPSMAVAAFTAALGRPPAGAAQREFPIDFRRAYPPVPVKSVADILAGRASLAEVTGRAVFVGSTAPILQDLWPTPIGGTTPGVMIQAIEFRHLIAEDSGYAVLHDATFRQQLLWLVLTSACGAAVGRSSRTQRILRSLALASLTPFVALAVVMSSGLLLEPVSILFVVAAHYALGVESIRAGIQNRLLQREYSIGALGTLARIPGGPVGPANVGPALALLGQATGADALTLLSARADRSIDADGVRWSRRIGAPAEVRLDLATEALAARESRRTTDPSRRFAHVLYLPIASGTQAVGVLVSHYRSGPPDPSQLETTESFATLAALALVTDRLLDDLRRSRDAAEAATRAKSAFLAHMSHEIRTPMTAVLGYLELLENPALPEDERAEMMTALRANGEHMMALIGSILDLGQLETDKVVVTRERFDPLALAREVESMLRPRAQAAGLQLEVSSGLAVPDQIESDRSRVRQILVNLAANALRFTDDGWVRIKVGSDDGSDVAYGLLRFEVSDSGIGIPSTDLALIFEPFVQGDSSLARRRSGAGLGLAIAKGLVGLLGGSISVSSRAGEGSVFSFSVAIGRVEDREADRGPASRPMAKPSAAVRLTGRVLVVDDGPDNRRILIHFLRNSGLDVSAAEDGQTACELVEAAAHAGTPFDLVFMDVAMPVLDGHEATRRIRRSGLVVPIVALTAHATADDRKLAIAAGCDEYLSKPITREKLVAVAATYLATRKREP